MLPADWYVRQLRERDPQLAVPFDYYDGRENSLKTLVEANPSRPFAMIGAPSDTSLDHDYFAYLHGLANLVAPKSKQIMLDEMVRDNERLLNNYRPPSPVSINRKNFENEILTLYAQPPWRIGTEYERVGEKAEARRWYERALALDPDFPRAREALARLE
jgi:tetratricopeptide (TPR) repeat protein